MSTPAQGPLRMPMAEPMELAEEQVVSEGGNAPLLVTRTAATAPQATSMTSPGTVFCITSDIPLNEHHPDSPIGGVSCHSSGAMTML